MDIHLIMTVIVPTILVTIGFIGTLLYVQQAYYEYKKKRNKLSYNERLEFQSEVNQLTKEREVQDNYMKSLKRNCKNEIKDIKKECDQKIYQLLNDLDTGKYFNLNRYIDSNCTVRYDNDLKQLLEDKILYYINGSDKLLTKNELDNLYKDGGELVTKTLQENVTKLEVPFYLLNAGYTADEVKRYVVINNLWKWEAHRIGNALEQDMSIAPQLIKALESFQKEMSNDTYFVELLKTLKVLSENLKTFENDIEKREI